MQLQSLLPTRVWALGLNDKSLLGYNGLLGHLQLLIEMSLCMGINILQRGTKRTLKCLI